MNDSINKTTSILTKQINQDQTNANYLEHA